MGALNYKHLHYFWVVAKTGGVARAGEQLHLTPQSISGQLSVLEEALGEKLLRRAGRNLELTDVGRLVLSYADEIFTLGEELQAALASGVAGRPLQFRVGVADMVPKTVAYHLLEPAMALPETLRIVCREGRLASLLADLAVHKLDLVISDRAMPATLNVRGFNHLLGECGMTFLASPRLARQYGGDFPRGLDGAPLLLPGEDAAVRLKLMRWFEVQRIRPRIVGEFDDGALLKAFGRAGVGIFAVPSVIEAETAKQFDVVPIGQTDEVTEQFYAISAERRLTHPAVVAIRNTAHKKTFDLTQAAKVIISRPKKSSKPG
jgi:LysR family transcriptional regulator, transcriptional activator of nhaA